MKIKQSILMAISLLITVASFAQGPPIITDKPIMIGEKRIVIKTLSRVEVRKNATFYKIPLMGHYVIKPNLLVVAHLPLAGYFLDVGEGIKKTGLGDVNLQVKYQFFRWDESRKTARAAVKLQQYFPTGINTGNYEISIGEWQTFAGLTFGYEALRYGLGANIGYHYVADKSDFKNPDFFHYKVSVGLPLMPLVYPPKQINLYFEYDGEVNLQNSNHSLFMAQGIQYAIKRLTFEMAVKFPIFQQEPLAEQQKYTLLFGTRFII